MIGKFSGNISRIPLYKQVNIIVGAPHTKITYHSPDEIQLLTRLLKRNQIGVSFREPVQTFVHLPCLILFQVHHTDEG
ncbi:hypothetical protein SDC9_79317 [bioreactor metagenome]|uniref:Uncharacterized protein n=1 Tax=bioreactor metagenome TaxID=1076179 RepID=A0A644YWA5_9ZZZZ